MANTAITLIAGALSILTTWGILLAASTGIGLILRRAFGLKTVHFTGLLTSCLLGISLNILFLQLWHLFSPITWLTTAIVLVTGFSGLLWNVSELGNWCRRNFSKVSVAFVSTLFFIGIWLSNRATGPCSAHDSGMYHMPFINWIKSLAIVPGLGNLHGRFAFNNSNLLYAAMLDIGPWLEKSFHLVNGLFIFLLFIQIIYHIFNFRTDCYRKRANGIFNTALLAPAVALILNSYHISSFTPDCASAVLLFLAASLLFAQLTGSDKNVDSKKEAYNLVVLSNLLIMAICFKLSAAVFSSVMLVVAIIVWLRRYKPKRSLLINTIIWIFMTSGALGLTWAGRGVILSGYPAYPISFGSFAVEWRIPAEQAEAEKDWIGHFARNITRGADASNNTPYEDSVLSQWRWVYPWARSLLRHPDALYFISLPTFLCILCIAAHLILRNQNKWIARPSASAWLLLFPIICGIVFWFLTAPRPKFGLFLFWTLFALCAAQILGIYIGYYKHHLKASILTFSFLLGLATLPITRQIIDMYRNQEIYAFYAVIWALCIPPNSHFMNNQVPYVKLQNFTTNSGLQLYVPKSDNCCWNSPLFCTPHPSQNLRLRNNDSLKFGFMTDGSWQQIRWPNPQTAFLSSWREYQTRTR